MKRALGLATNLRLGQTIYEEVDELEKTQSQFTFFEMDIAPHIVRIKSSSLGMGSGIRVNCILGQKFIETTEVNDLRVFPTLHLAFSL